MPDFFANLVVGDRVVQSVYLVHTGTFRRLEGTITAIDAAKNKATVESESDGSLHVVDRHSLYYEPSAEQIRDHCRRIQSSWDGVTERQRRGADEPQPYAVPTGLRFSPADCMGGR